jgi:hypothetical protein
MDHIIFYAVSLFISFCALIFVLHQVFVSSRTLAEFRTFEDYVLSYNKIVDPALKKKVEGILLGFLKRDQRYLSYSPRSWERLGRYMERVRAYTSIIERGEYAPKTVSSEALHIECAEFLKSTCGNWFSFQDCPHVTYTQAEYALESLHRAGAFTKGDTAYELLEQTFGQQVRMFIKISLRQEYIGMARTEEMPIPEEFLAKLEQFNFTLKELTTPSR